MSRKLIGKKFIIYYIINDRINYHEEGYIYVMENLSRLVQDTSAAFNSSGYAFFHIESHIFCIIMAVILFICQQNSSDQAGARIIWSRLLLVQVLYFLAKIFRVLVDINIFTSSDTLQYVAACINFVCFGLICLLGFIYSELRQDTKIFAALRNKIFSALPFALNILILVLSPLYIDIQDDSIFYLVHMINLFYPFAALVRSFSRLGAINKFAFYPVLIVIFGPVQLLNPRLPLLCFVMLTADLLVYIYYVDSLISIDPLTKIHNRNGFIRDLTNKFNLGERENLYLFAIDIEDLSSINRRFGRLEGDRALIITAKALKDFSENEYLCIAARYYGDEFMIIANIDNNELELFTERIRNYVINSAAKNKLKYFLRVNIGFAKYENYSRTETISGLINEAVRSLNEAREQRR
ncbi:MAG: GGDEF domain-containing protein [Synergistaceae bacterium]|nr:GGDEF domain-containing protein [Synergistaceae bacterium]